MNLIIARSQQPEEQMPIACPVPSRWSRKTSILIVDLLATVFVGCWQIDACCRCRCPDCIMQPQWLKSSQSCSAAENTWRMSDVFGRPGPRDDADDVPSINYPASGIETNNDACVAAKVLCMQAFMVVTSLARPWHRMNKGTTNPIDACPLGCRFYFLRHFIWKQHSHLTFHSIISWMGTKGAERDGPYS